MIIIICGLPFSGKSTFVNLIMNDHGSSCLLLRPSDWMPDFGDNDVELRRSYAITCNQIAYEKAISAISEVPDKLIILDQCNTKVESVMPLFAAAKECNRPVCVLFVTCKPSICKNRVANTINDELWKRYITELTECVPKYKKLADHFAIIHNDDDRKLLNEQKLSIENIICQNI